MTCSLQASGNENLIWELFVIDWKRGRCRQRGRLLHSSFCAFSNASISFMTSTDFTIKLKMSAKFMYETKLFEKQEITFLVSLLNVHWFQIALFYEWFVQLTAANSSQ